ncbi:hypothetical protein N7495_007318 [Penicillium taxi]|uniref:uncharacterized protein n=1 Tax=Penicillium taxi TaxID=168475 RepID=UPI0025454F27|nr:uncharacterized protein N7495_007318 [Penicillium taxi]KAJ5895627.1 hypothetical protein N7495_007318 [Penicillium taxi]
MSSASHWGTLINPDKSPAPLLEQLCLGVAKVMPSFDDDGTTDLTPERLAAFYRVVGGNYDPLFLDTKLSALSFIYQSLGCFHSIQPSKNPYEPPSIPSLLPNGFVRWQTIQLLLDPDEHARLLHNAVTKWDIAGPDGEVLPKEIPRDAFPSEPDPEMVKWHESVCKRLEDDYVKRNSNRTTPPDFNAYHYHFSGKDPLPDEDEYLPHPSSRSASRHHKHYDSDRSSRRRNQRRPSADYPTYTSRKPDPAYFLRPDGGRSGYTSPRVRSPSPRPDCVRSSRGRAGKYYGHPLSHGRNEEPVDDVSDILPFDEFPGPKHRSRKTLSPGSHARARRHSHDAYTRKPVRELSPRRSQRAYSRSPKKSQPYDEVYEIKHKAHRDGHPRSRPPPDLEFRDFGFDGHHVPTAPEPPIYAKASRPVQRHRHNIDPYLEDRRRESYGGSSAGSRPGSGSSGSDRPRSFSNAGPHPRSSRWTSPQRSSTTNRYIPTVAEDIAYVAPRSRRTRYE